MTVLFAESSRAPVSRRTRGRGVAVVLWIAGLAASARAAGEPGLQRSFDSLAEAGRAPAGFRLGLSLRDSPEIRLADLQSAAESAPAEPKLQKIWIGVVTLGTLGGSAYNSFGDGPSQAFHFTNEQWFGRTTYVGGGDKASHFVSYNAVSRLLTMVYNELGVPTDSARILGSGVSALAGLVTELGDGTTKYGFSYEDLVWDSLGAATALLTAHYGYDDLIGFRFGLVPYPKVHGQPNGGFGKDYTQEIYTGDLKISGLAKRLHFRPGPARFLLLSTSYGVKGYPYAVPSVRERQIGIEVGLHLAEIARALRLPNRTWWQRSLYFLFDTIRLPYTSIGFQYDLNHKRWHGPGIGDSFPGGGH
jgi:hypothetical protein